MDREKEWLLREKYHGEKTEGFFADLKRLESGEPLAYIIGNIPFLDNVIYLDSKPLIPRPETEYWVSAALEDITINGGSTPSILDLCAGSGCIGVSVLAAFPGARVDFVEIDEGHHQTILKNLEINDLKESRFNILGGDLFERVTDTYDFILTNPPYIDVALGRTEESVAQHEPPRALWGGERGLECITKIITNAPRHLNPGGVLYLEHEPEQAEAVYTLATTQHFEVERFPDQFGIIRYTRAQY